MASDAPVERTGTGTFWRGDGIVTWNTRAPRPWRARSASCTFTGRLWLSDMHGHRILAVDPGGHATTVAELPIEGEKAQVQLNVQGVHDLVLAVLPGMIARHGGGILISGSAAGNSPIPNNATYAASKAFANTFSESLRGELKPHGINVTLLAPGPVRTELPDPSEQSLVERLIPDFLWIDTEYTARVSLDGLEKNKMRVVPGLTSKAMSVASGYAPRAVVAPIVGAVYKKLGGD